MHKPLKREFMHKNSAMDTLALQCYVHLSLRNFKQYSIRDSTQCTCLRIV